MRTEKKPNIFVRIATGLLVVFAIFMMLFTITTVATVDQNDRSLFGIKFYIVQTDSMSESELNKDFDVHFSAGDIVVIKELEDATSLQAGDIIAFVSTNKESYGETITHCIREVKTNENGRVLGYVTYGTNTGVNDEALVEPHQVLGVHTFTLPRFGDFFAFVKTPKGYVACILIPFTLLIFYNCVNVMRLFFKYKYEQKELMLGVLAVKEQYDEEEAYFENYEDTID